ncbi:MAG: putative inorganic carbon transporter subunit DabA, partial [Thiotrichaceae bacterium]
MVHDYIQQQRDLLQTAIAGLDAVLPIQAPLQDFIHFNPLMNYEHLPFAQALRQVYEQSGSIGYLPATDYRKCYKHGRINRHDINSILEQDNVPASERELYLTILVNNIKAISFQQMRWQVEENRALEQFQSNVAFEQREKLLEAAEQSEAVAIQALWEACLQRLELNYDLPHPEALLNLRLKNINEVWDSIKQQGMVGETADADSLITEQSRHQLLTLLGQVGDDITLRTLLKRLTNLDIMEEIQPQLTRYMATWLDQGIASLHSQRAMQGFYAFWRHQALQDITPWLEGLETWRDYVSSLDDDPLETIRHELIRIGIDKAHWGAYLRTLALEL